MKNIKWGPGHAISGAVAGIALTLCAQSVFGSGNEPTPQSEHTVNIQDETLSEEKPLSSPVESSAQDLAQEECNSDFDAFMNDPDVTRYCAPSPEISESDIYADSDLPAPYDERVSREREQSASGGEEFNFDLIKESVPEEFHPVIAGASITTQSFLSLDDDLRMSKIGMNLSLSEIDCAAAERLFEKYKPTIEAQADPQYLDQISAHADQLFSEGKTVRGFDFNKAVFSGMIFSDPNLSPDIIDQFPERIKVNLEVSCYGHYPAVSIPESDL
jgi:hypothetical protein